VVGARGAHPEPRQNVILVVFGTTGELIKLAPVLLRLDHQGQPYLLATTGQQVEQIPSFLEQFGLRQPDLWLARGARGRDLRVNSDIPGWLARVTRSWLGHRRRVRRRLHDGRGGALVLVHGDTMTTVLGSMIGRSLHAPVAHIEGGLRSYDLRHPFPEELNRKVATALSRIHYAPGAWAASNLHRGEVVDTGSNTIRDSLELVADEQPPVTLPERPFGIVSLHRFELLNNRRLLTETIEVLADSAHTTPLLFIDHPVTIAALERFSLTGFFDSSAFMRIPRLRFFDFVRVERRSAFVVTDSGGSQEECYYLDLPCLVHRVKTERREGLGENAVLSEMSSEVLRNFLDSPGRFRRTTSLTVASPSDIIIGDLEQRGFVSETGVG
jgi:UDP-N-acetylglucosamine 2-epimerase (non-hydrolysing)